MAFAAAPATPQGTITGKGFLNIGGTAVANLTSNAKFPDNPDVKYYYPYFEWNADAAGDINTPANNAYGENYGAQMQGYFYPPSTGDYVFYLSADDGAQLFLSTDDDPANKKLIAQESGWSNPRQWESPGGSSTIEEKNSSTFAGTQWATKDASMGGAKITLTKGKAYYIEALVKEGGGGDNLAVAVMDPQGAIDATLPIPGAYLSPFGASSAAKILAQPKNAAVYAGGTANFSVGLDLPPNVSVTSTKWQKNGVDIPDSDSTTLALKTASADNGAKIKAIITTSAGVLTSEEAILTVATFAPEFAQGVVKFEAFTGIGGTAVDALVNDPKYLDNTPDDMRLIAGIDSPNAYGDNYGAKVSGFIIPPTSGDYRFFIRSDDASQLWLSTDDKEANAQMIAEETGCCNAFTEPDAGTTRTSEPVSLVAGRKYAFYALVKEGGGGDYLQVAARKEGDTTPASGLTPLSGAWVGVNAKPNMGDPVITEQPKAPAQAEVGRPLALTVNGVVTPEAYNFPFIVQWQKNGQNIPGAISRTLLFNSLTLADSGTYRAVVSAPSGKTVNSTEIVLNVVEDAFAPLVKGVGALSNGSTFDVGVQFDESVTEASASATANYSISAGTITGVKFYPKSPGVVLTVSGLTVGNQYTLTVKDVADLKGNKMSSTSKSFTVSPLKWGVVGGNEVGTGNAVLPVGNNGFDIYSDGIAEWAAYDEATFVYEEITGDFDKKLRVEFQDNSSQWARAGLIVRDVPNFGVGRAAQEGGEAGRYQKVHVNPSGPTLTGPGNMGNNQWEGNRRLDTGGQTSSAGGGGTPLYPNAWVRLQRQGDTFIIYRSDDGKAWTELGRTTFTEPMPAKLYVGPEYSPENGNVTEEASRGTWLAKIRDYSDTFAMDSGMRDYGIGLNFGANEAGGSLAAADAAGAPGVVQANWNNINGQTGSTNGIMAVKKDNTTETTPVTVFFTSNGTWASTGRGEENNGFTGGDKTLMTGYLDTGDATTTSVTISNIPPALTGEGYDVYVYAMGGVAAGRSGGYRILDASSKAVLKDYVFATSPTNAATQMKAPLSIDKTAPGVGTYILFTGLNAANITIEASTANGLGGGTPPRAPINAVQLVAPTTGTVGPGPAPELSVARSANGLTITFTGSLESADAVTGPWSPVTGASPMTVPATGAGKFYRAKQ